MKRKLPKFTHGYVDQYGKAKFFLRRAGHKKVRLPGLPWSPEFMAAREAALKGEWDRPETRIERTTAGSVNAAIVSYYQCTAFKDGLAESSQKMRRAILEKFRAEHGDKRIALMHRKALQTILDRKSPAAASNWRKALRGLITHAMSVDMLATDPLVGIERVPVQSKEHHPWNMEECALFEAHHAIGTRARLAYELLLQAGHARSDVIRMGRQHIRDGVLSLSRQKTGVAFDVPVMPMLQQAISAMPPSNHLTFLITAQGKPFTAAGFGNYFRDVCNEAGLPKRCTSHGLRAAAATRAADRGATTTQLKAWFGWKRDSEAERYTRHADRKKAAAAMGRLMTETNKSATESGSAEILVSQNDT